MSNTLSLSRELYVPRELVFDAWTQREHVAQWYAPEHCHVGEVVVEPAVGGRFDVAWTDPAGTPVSITGEFLEFSRPEGFVCRQQSGEGGGAQPYRLRLELSDLVDACRIELQQHGCSEESVRLFANLWEQRLDRLEAYFSAI